MKPFLFKKERDNRTIFSPFSLLQSFSHTKTVVKTWRQCYVNKNSVRKGDGRRFFRKRCEKERKEDDDDDDDDDDDVSSVKRRNQKDSELRKREWKVESESLITHNTFHDNHIHTPRIWRVGEFSITVSLPFVPPEEGIISEACLSLTTIFWLNYSHEDFHLQSRRWRRFSLFMYLYSLSRPSSCMVIMHGSLRKNEWRAGIARQAKQQQVKKKGDKNEGDESINQSKIFPFDYFRCNRWWW